MRGGYFLTAAFILFYLCISFSVARFASDPHLMNRMGALLAAIGALLVVWQVLAEVRMESLGERDEESASDGDMSPTNREVAARVRASRTTARRKQRLQIVGMVSVVVFVGELMHGWGDYLYFGASH